MLPSAYFFEICIPYFTFPYAVQALEGAWMVSKRKEGKSIPHPFCLRMCYMTDWRLEDRTNQSWDHFCHFTLHNFSPLKLNVQNSSMLPSQRKAGATEQLNTGHNDLRAWTASMAHTAASCPGMRQADGRETGRYRSWTKQEMDEDDRTKKWRDWMMTISQLHGECDSLRGPEHITVWK